MGKIRAKSAAPVVPKAADAVLCFVKKPWAWFTTQPFDKQWGDDFDDAPYEHNAGEPYTPRVYHMADGTNRRDPEHWHADGMPKWDLFKVAWEGEFETPDEGHSNSPYSSSPYSVQDINRGDVAWLRPSRYGRPRPDARPIPAGTTLVEFVRLVRLGGGKVYVELSGDTLPPMVGLSAEG